MNSALIKAIADGIVGVLRESIEAQAREITALRMQLGEIPAGAPGVGIKSIAQAEDRQTADIELDNGQVVELQLPIGPAGDRGERGDKGERGEEGAAPSAEDVAAALRELPEFVAAATPDVLHPPPWQPGIHRKGAVVGAFMGRLYCAEKDTAAEPGESADWCRVGTQGMRHIGGLGEATLLEPGDIYTKNASTFVFDGARSWLLAPRPYTAADAEKDAKETAKAIAGLRQELAELKKVLQ